MDVVIFKVTVYTIYYPIPMLLDAALFTGYLQ